MTFNARIRQMVLSSVLLQPSQQPEHVAERVYTVYTPERLQAFAVSTRCMRAMYGLEVKKLFAPVHDHQGNGCLPSTAPGFTSPLPRCHKQRRGTGTLWRLLQRLNGLSVDTVWPQCLREKSRLPASSCA